VATPTHPFFSELSELSSYIIFLNKFFGLFNQIPAADEEGDALVELFRLEVEDILVSV